MDETEREFREAIRRNPNDADAHVRLGVLLENQGSYDEADRELKESYRLRRNLK